MGKTTIAKALCNELGYDYILLNLSNDRGIDTLRTTIASFASTVSLSGDKKCVILDEFDSSTQILQAAFKAFMEQYSENCSFIMTCNHPNQIIQPIHSRCSVVDFNIRNTDKPNLAKQMFERAMKILDHEEITYDKKPLIDVVMKYFPDYRRTLNELQRYAAATGKIDAEIVKYASSDNITDFIAAIKTKKFKDAKAWISANLGNMSQDTIYRSIYNNMHEYIAPNSIPSAILILADFQYKGTLVPDIELHMAALAITLMSEVEFV